MATTSSNNQFGVSLWTPQHGLARYVVNYRVRIVKERWRRLLALVFSAIIALIIGTVVVSLEPVNTGAKTIVVGMVSTVGMTLIALIFGIEINDVSITRDGAELNFGDSMDRIRDND